MPARYALRMSYGLQADQENTLAELLDVCEKTLTDEIVFMIFTEAFNNGHETLDEICTWMDLIRPWVRALKDAGVNPNLGLGDLYAKIGKLPEAKKAEKGRTMTAKWMRKTG